MEGGQHLIGPAVFLVAKQVVDPDYGQAAYGQGVDNPGMLGAEAGGGGHAFGKGYAYQPYHQPHQQGQQQPLAQQQQGLPKGAGLGF